MVSNLAQEVDKNTHVSHLALVQMDCVYPILNPCSFIWTDFKRQFLLCVRIVGKYDDPSILLVKKFNVLFQSQNLIQNGVIKDSSSFFIFTFDTKQEGEGLIIFLQIFDTFIKTRWSCFRVKLQQTGNCKDLQLQLDMGHGTSDIGHQTSDMGHGTWEIGI